MKIPLFIELFKEVISNDLKNVLLEIQKEQNNIDIEHVQPELIHDHKNGSIELVVECFTFLEVMEAHDNSRK